VHEERGKERRDEGKKRRKRSQKRRTAKRRKMRAGLGLFRWGPAPAHTCSEFELGTSPQELDRMCAPWRRHQSMHLMACSRLPLPSAFMKRHGISETA
jgi:hypothetical protein